MKILLLLLFSVNVLAGTKINQPLMTLVDKDGVKVATDSTSVAKAMEKASQLVEGVYTLIRPDITITVTKNKINDTNNANISWTAPTQNTDNTPLTDLDGFNVYYGLSEDELSTKIYTENAQLLIEGLTPNTYYFAIRAINSLGIESVISSIVSKTII